MYKNDYLNIPIEGKYIFLFCVYVNKKAIYEYHKWDVLIKTIIYKYHRQK